MASDRHLVDVFARKRYAGNQLAVVESDGTVIERLSRGLSRPSLVAVHATDQGDDVRIEVGGRVVPVARGELL